MEALSSLESVITSFPFFYRPKGLRLGDAWHFHPPERYQRVARETNAWRLSEVNENFSLCPSYPRAVIVARAVKDRALALSSRFRRGGRCPVLSHHRAPANRGPTHPDSATKTNCGPSRPFPARPGQFVARLQPGLLPFLADPQPPSNGPRPCALPSPRPRPLRGFRVSPISGPAPGPWGPWSPVVFLNPGPTHVLLFGSLSPRLHPTPAGPHALRVPPLGSFSSNPPPTSSRPARGSRPPPHPQGAPRAKSPSQGRVAKASGVASRFAGSATFQPAPTGPQKRCCAEDEELLRAAGAGPGARGFILDTRSAQAAKQALVTGGGTEARGACPGWEPLHWPLAEGRGLHPGAWD
uniref:Myotubularin phosphatase domain-containing protein n=1 Tax=Canis lupus familiaris TaxID=9615 RepID=A0A8C0TD69_CANLF